MRSVEEESINMRTRDEVIIDLLIEKVLDLETTVQDQHKTIMDSIEYTNIVNEEQASAADKSQTLQEVVIALKEEVGVVITTIEEAQTDIGALHKLNGVLTNVNNIKGFILQLDGLSHSTQKEL